MIIEEDLRNKFAFDFNCKRIRKMGDFSLLQKALRSTIPGVLMSSLTIWALMCNLLYYCELLVYQWSENK